MRVHLLAFGWALACALTSAQAAEVIPDSSFESTSHAWLESYSLQNPAPCDFSLFYWITTGASGDFGIIGYNGELGEAMEADSATFATAAEIAHNPGGHFTLMLDPQLRLAMGAVPRRLISRAEDGLIPEPATLTLMATGILALLAVKRYITR